MTTIEADDRGRALAVGGLRIFSHSSLFVIFLVVQAIAWTALPPTVFSAPKSNTVELSLWARDWFVVNYKHPGLSAWLLAAAYDMFGVHLWVSLLLAQLCIAATYSFVFLLGRDLMGSGAALLGTLPLVAVAFFTVGTFKYNHNIAQLPLWVAFCFGLWRAADNDRLWWWIFTGVIAALGLYAKFTMLMPIAFGALWLLLDNEARRRFNSRALYVALLVFLVLLLPLFIGLGLTDFGSVEWVSAESTKRGISGLHFIRDVGQTILIIAAALVVGMALNRLKLDRISEPRPTLDRRGLFFLLVMGGGPMFLTLTIALAKPSRLEWTAPMYSMIGLLLIGSVIHFRPSLARWAGAGLPHAVIALAASLWVLGTHTAAAVQDRAAGKIDRMLWPAPEIAQRFDSLWQRSTGQPLRIVAGDSWTAGVVGLMSDGHPSLFTDVNPHLSPAISEPRLKRQGALILWADNSSWRPDPSLIGRFPHGSETFSVGRKAEQLTIDYLLVAPGQWTDADSEQWLEPTD
jgi:4-amino-4-deoxy-L-arabinose transferase-like glycosyltransferase